MRRIAMVGVFLLLAEAQRHPTIEVGENRLLSTCGPARPLAESQLSTEPNNPKHLLVGVIQFDSPDGNDKTCVAWSSFDGGYEWTRHAFPARGCADPWGAVLPDGSAVIVLLGYMAGHDDNAFLFRSPDGGRTWSDAPLGLADHHDHPMVVARGNELYVVSSQGIQMSATQRRSSAFVIHSPDDGKTFGQPTHAIPSILGFAAVGPILLSDGTLVVGIHDPSRQGAVNRPPRPHSWLLRSPDQGKTFSEPLLVSESCESRGGWPSMAVDGKDRLFWLCVADRFNGVLVQRSDDQGKSWSEPLRLNHSETPDSFTPSIAVNRDGIVGVSWYEIHDKSCFDVYFTASLDGGKTFLPEVRVSSATSCPDTPRDKGAFDAGTTFGAGGDYSGLAATSDGIFHLVWSDARTGIYQLRTASVAVKP
jgi:photosystem II stability/assembly factor-like uncharacterized protein